MNSGDYVIISKAEAAASAQIIRNEVEENGVLQPFFDFVEALELYYLNTYHARSIRLKAALLSQIEESDLDGRTPGSTPKRLLNSFMINMEIFGNGFLEQAGIDSRPVFYLLPSIEGRIDRNGNVFQFADGIPSALTGHHLFYYSPASRFYGEPDYLTVWRKIRTDGKIDAHNEKFFDNGAKPDLAIIFKNSEPSPEQLKAFRTFFSTNFKGYANAHRTLIMSTGVGEKDADIELEELNAVADMSFKNLREANRDEIIAAHNVPPRLVGVITPGQIGAGNELLSQLHMLNETEILPKIEIVEGFFDSIGVKMKLRPLDVTSFVDDAGVVGGLVQMGIITQQEAREIIGWKKAIE